jgi:hypothetical protein
MNCKWPPSEVDHVYDLPRAAQVLPLVNKDRDRVMGISNADELSFIHYCLDSGIQVMLPVPGISSQSKAYISATQFKSEARLLRHH